MKIDLQIFQDEQLRQQRDDLAADRRKILNQQQVQLEQRRADFQEFKGQVQQEREAIQQPEPREASGLEQACLVEEDDRPYSPFDQYDESRLSAWKIYCLGQLEKPDGVHTQRWEAVVGKATGEPPSPAISFYQQSHEYVSRSRRSPSLRQLNNGMRR